MPPQDTPHENDSEDGNALDLNNKGRPPSFPLYCRDILADPDLVNVSPAGHGVMLKLLCLCWLSNRQGYLLVGDSRPTDAILASLLRWPVKDVQEGVSELLRHKILSRDPQGILYSRRMVRDVARFLQKRKATAARKAKWKQSKAQAPDDSESTPPARPRGRPRGKPATAHSEHSEPGQVPAFNPQEVQS